MTSSEPFVTLQIFGVPAPAWHAWSNKAYIVMLAAIVTAGWIERAKLIRSAIDK